MLESRKITENIELACNTSQPPGAKVPLELEILLAQL